MKKKKKNNPIKKLLPRIEIKDTFKNKNNDEQSKSKSQQDNSSEGKSMRKAKPMDQPNQKGPSLGSGLLSIMKKDPRQQNKTPWIWKQGEKRDGQPKNIIPDTPQELLKENQSAYSDFRTKSDMLSSKYREMQQKKEQEKRKQVLMGKSEESEGTDAEEIASPSEHEEDEHFESPDEYPMDRNSNIPGELISSSESSSSSSSDEEKTKLSKKESLASSSSSDSDFSLDDVSSIEKLELEDNFFNLNYEGETDDFDKYPVDDRFDTDSEYEYVDTPSSEFLSPDEVPSEHSLQYYKWIITKQIMDRKAYLKHGKNARMTISDEDYVFEQFLKNARATQDFVNAKSGEKYSFINDINLFNENPDLEEPNYVHKSEFVSGGSLLESGESNVESEQLNKESGDVSEPANHIDDGLHEGEDPFATGTEYEDYPSSDFENHEIMSDGEGVVFKQESPEKLIREQRERKQRVLSRYVLSESEEEIEEPEEGSDQESQQKQPRILPFRRDNAPNQPFIQTKITAPETPVVDEVVEEEEIVLDENTEIVAEGEGDAENIPVNDIVPDEKSTPGFNLNFRRDQTSNIEAIEKVDPYEAYFDDVLTGTRLLWMDVPSGVFEYQKVVEDYIARRKKRRQKNRQFFKKILSAKPRLPLSEQTTSIDKPNWHVIRQELKVDSTNSDTLANPNLGRFVIPPNHPRKDILLNAERAITWNPTYSQLEKVKVLHEIVKKVDWVEKRKDEEFELPSAVGTYKKDYV